MPLKHPNENKISLNLYIAFFKLIWFLRTLLRKDENEENHGKRTKERVYPAFPALFQYLGYYVEGFYSVRNLLVLYSATLEHKEQIFQSAHIVIL